MHRFGFAVPLLLPFLLVVHLEQGGAWTWAPVAFVFGVLPLLDLVAGRDTWSPSTEQAAVLEREFFYRGILFAWVPLQMILLGWVAWRSHALSLQGWEFAGVVISTGVVTGAIGITIAHELGHKLDRREQWLGRVLLMSVCYMHFHIEHNKGHHARVATPNDPASAREGQSLFAFLPQTLIGSFASAWHFEAERLAKEQRAPWSGRNQVLRGLAGSLAMLAIAAALGGGQGVLLFVGQSMVAILLLETINYIEHYGLERQPRDGGGYERVSVAHAWNASERLTNWFLFNLQRHSHHHVEHHRRYQVLKHVDASPQLPTGYAGMLLLALVPPLWHRVMDARLAAWRREHAT